MRIRNSLLVGYLWFSALALTSCKPGPPPVVPTPSPTPQPTPQATPSLELPPLPIEEPSVPLFAAPPTPILPAQRNFIIVKEVGSASQAYYGRNFANLIWPGGSSGITGGIGWDFGTQNASTILRVWNNHEERKRLVQLAGIMGAKAKAILPKYRDIVIPYWMAIEVYDSDTIPRYYQQMVRAWPKVVDLDPVAQGALLSIVFNRGPGMVGDSRVDMRSIARAIPSKDYKEIATAVRHMNITMGPAWKRKGVWGGLSKRRIAEAVMIESCIR